MHILAANLKHLYQKKMVFFWHGLFLITAVIIALYIKSEPVNTLALLWLCVFLFAVIPTVLTVETFTMPFSFCLPGHRRIPQKVAFTLAPAVGIFWTMIFFITPGFDLWGLNFLAFFSFISATYLVSAWLIFRLGSKFVNVVFCLIVLVYLLDFLVDELRAVPLHLITHYPLWIIIISTSLGVILWRRMADESIVRRYSKAACTAAPSYGLFSDMPVKATEDKNTIVSRASRFIEQFLLGRIADRPTGSLSKYIWGTLYGPYTIKMLDKVNWKNIAFFGLVILILGYFILDGNQIFWLIFVSSAFESTRTSLCKNVFSSLLIAGGRKERFYAAVVFNLFVSFIMSVMILTFFLLTLFLSRVLPPIRSLSYHSMSPLLAIYSLIFVPLSEGLYLFLSRKLAIWWCRAMIFLLAIIGIIPFVEGDISVSPILLVSVVLISWAFFARVLWNTTRHGNLV